MSNNNDCIKICLLIGINYTGTDNALSGCINDSMNLKKFLVNNHYFKDDDFIMMNDTQTGELYPTKANMLKMFSNLVRKCNQNRNKKVLFFFSYSGHGTNVRDYNGDEDDGLDEALCPIDCHSTGVITDDVLKNVLINKLHNRVKFVSLIDACHSGTMLDLKYNYNVDSRNTQKIYGSMEQTRCTCVMISGCRDNQTSADAWINRQSQGAMTASFIANYHSRKNYNSLIIEMRKWLKRQKYTQIPQLSSGRPLNIYNEKIFDLLK